MRSTFPEQIDQFVEHFDISPADIPHVKRYQYLKMQEILTPEEEIELQNLTILLRDKIFTPEDFNKLQDCIVNMEIFIKDEVDEYIKDKQEEFNNVIGQFNYMGTYNPQTQYYKNNFVTYNDGQTTEVYLAIKDTLGNLPTNTAYWRKLSVRGPEGRPGLGLTFRGSYDSSIVYHTGDLVEYNGSTFYCKEDDTLAVTPGSDPNVWGLFVSKGAAITVSHVAPPSPALNQLWVDTGV